MDTQDSFINGGIYRLIKFVDTNCVFLCEASTGQYIGRLVRFDFKPTYKYYERTKTTYFLNCYKPGDIKEIFLTRENYEQVGKLGNNFCLSNDGNKLLRGIIC